MLDGTLLAVAIILGLAITTALVIGVALRRSRRRAPAVAPPTDANADGASEPIGELTDDAPADMAPSPARPESLPQEEQPRGLPGGRPEGAVGWLDRDIAAMAAGPPRRRRATDDTRLVLFDRADGHDGSQQAAPPRLRIAVDWDGHTNWLMSSTLDARGFLGHVVAGAAGGTPPVGTAVRASTHLDGTSLTAPGEVTSSTLGPRGPVLSVSFTELDGEQRALLTRLSPEGTR